MAIERWLRSSGENDFRWRGEEVSRVEALSDAVFALTLTLLAITDISLAGDDLLGLTTLWPHFVTLGVTFAILAWIWNCHFLFFRRYGLRDGYSRTLNYFLLFLVLCYAYPLKGLFGYLVEAFFFGGGWRVGDRSTTRAEIEREMAEVMIIYSLGLGLVFVVYALMYAHAWRLREQLDLNAVERHRTRTVLREHLLVVAIAVSSILIAALVPRGTPWAGMIYFLIGPVLGIHGFIRGREHDRLVRALEQGAEREPPAAEATGSAQAASGARRAAAGDSGGG